ncbi:MAG: ATP-binding protein [Desulfobacteraceae bacterium]|nr:ATP-binding protein [Desulfobacteraceae bacterium]
MSSLALISLCTVVIYVYLGANVYLKQPDNALNRTFFIYSVLTVYTCFTDFQMRLAESYAMALFWFRVGSLWHVLICALLHFVFVFTRLAERKWFFLVYFPLYLIGLTFGLMDYYGGLVLDGPKPSPWGWSYGVVRETLIGNLFFAFNVGLIILGIILCLRYLLKLTNIREKQQAKYVLIGTSVPMLAGVLEVGCSRLDIEIPNLIQPSLALGAGFWAYAIWKYELFVLSPATTVKEIIQTMSDALFVITPERKIKVVNQAALNLLGYERHEVIDQPSRLLFEESEYQRSSTGPILSELAQRGFFSDVESTLRSKNGDAIPISLAGCVVRDKTGVPQGVALIGRDITRRKRQEQELRRYQEQLEDLVAERTAELEKTYAQLQRVQKMEFMGTIAGGVAHDLNNILSGIVSYPELLLTGLPKDSPLRKPLATIKKTGEKAATIVSDLLTLARREVSVKSVVNLNRVVQEYLQSPERHIMQAYHADCRITTRLAPDLLNVVGSPVHLSKSLMNLVNNGVEAMAQGGALIIATENRRVHETRAGYEMIDPGDYVALSVADAGVGIAATDIERIFEPFYTKKKMGKSGTGLGMAVVWGTVKDHGGYVDVASEVGRGTTFTLYFPASTLPEEDAPAPLPLEDYKGQGESVLVIDDVAEQREIACGILETLGYKALAVPSGEAAVAHLKQTRADILLLDMIMSPGIDGLETYKQILLLHPDQKAVIASGFSENERVKEAMALGACTFIRKPYSIERIGLTIRALLERPAEKSI